MKKSIFIFICLFLASHCFADTFTHRETGKIFHGYATKKKRDTKTLVCVENEIKPQYLNLADYNIEWNYLGRKDTVYILPITNAIELECETRAFEKGIEIASNHDPLFIIIEIDTPGGRADLMTRICDSICKTDNCRTIAFISGGKYGGAYSAGAVIALACDYIYMVNNTAIGAATPILMTPSGFPMDLKSILGETVGEKVISASRAYIATIAEQNGRSGLLAMAMVDKDIEVLEVIEDSTSFFVTPENRKPNQKILRTWSTKGSLLTLSAKDAVQCGIANGTISSIDNLFTKLNITKKDLRLYRDILKARQEFELAQSKINKIYLSISSLKKQTASLAQEVANLDEIIARSNRVGYYSDEYGPVLRSEEYSPTAINQFSQKSYRCFSLLETLKKECLQAMDLAKKHVDLNSYVTVLEEDLKFADGILARLQ